MLALRTPVVFNPNGPTCCRRGVSHRRRSARAAVAVARYLADTGLLCGAAGASGRSACPTC